MLSCTHTYRADAPSQLHINYITQFLLTLCGLCTVQFTKDILLLCKLSYDPNRTPGLLLTAYHMFLFVYIIPDFMVTDILPLHLLLKSLHWLRKKNIHTYSVVLCYIHTFGTTSFSLQHLMILTYFPSTLPIWPDYAQ